MEDQNYTYDLPPVWTFDNQFKFGNQDQEKRFKIEPKDVKVGVTDQMRRFKPLGKFFDFSKNVRKYFVDSEMQFSSGDVHQRLIFYSKERGFTAQEKQAIQEFKIMCKMNGRPIPQIDAEILRNLYGRKFNQENAY